MGSYPPQGSAISLISTTQDEAISVTDTFSTDFVIESNHVRDSAIVMFNDDATQSLIYRIYGTPKESTTVPADADTSWVNIIDREVEDPAAYDHNFSRSIPAKGTFYESFSNKWSWVRIEMKSSSGTITARVWHRGTTR